MSIVHRYLPRHVLFVVACLAITASNGQVPAAGEPFRQMVNRTRPVAEKCIVLSAGQAIGYAFETTDPLDFDIHYHRGEVVEYPVKNARVLRAADRFTAPVTAEYCLTWTSSFGYAVIIKGELRP